MEKQILQLLFSFTVCVTANTDDMPTVHESWIYSMIVLGFIGSVALIDLIIIATYKTYHKKVHALTTDVDKIKMRINIILTFGIWIFNACACLEWALLRTDLFFELTPAKCTVIYISNYLFYMLSKFCLHLLLLYRLFLAFHDTALYVNSVLLRLFAVLISIDFIVFVSLWLDICLQKVSVGVAVPSEALTFCTLYNNSSASQMTLYQKIWPMLFGAQDFIVGILTLTIFICKLNQLSRFSRHNSATEALVRKLFIMGSTSIFSTFMLFTFAVPFYSNLTFLLPLDALINSLCVLLLMEWTNTIYLKVCCGMDLCLQTVFRHESSKRDGANLSINLSSKPGIVLHQLNLSVRDSKNNLDITSNSAPQMGGKAGNLSPSTPNLKDITSQDPLETPQTDHASSTDVGKQTNAGSAGQH